MTVGGVLAQADVCCDIQVGEELSNEFDSGYDGAGWVVG